MAIKSKKSYFIIFRSHLVCTATHSNSGEQKKGALEKKLKVQKVKMNTLVHVSRFFLLFHKTKCRLRTKLLQNQSSGELNLYAHFQNKSNANLSS